jgi:GntR family transcriptional regulator
MSEAIPLRRADRARQVADVLRQQILAGTFDDAVPAEHTLATEFNEIRSRTGRAGRAEGDAARARRGAQRSGRGARGDPAVARRLRLAPGEQAVYLERLRYLDELPVSLDLTYLAPDIGAHVLEHDLAHNDVFALIEQFAGPLGSADLALEAVTADAHSAATLQLPQGGAVLLLERRSRLADGRPVDLECIRMRGDRITMRGSLSRRPDDSEWKVVRVALVNQRGDVPVTIDQSLCSTGCTLCVEICPLDSPAIDPDTGKAFMHVDECWYCGPCAARCPTDAVTVDMPYLLR